MSPLQKYFLFALFSSLVVFSSCQNEGTSEEKPADESLETVTPAVGEAMSREEAQALAEQKAELARATYSAALENGDATQCSSLESNDLRFSCEQSIIFNTAVREQDKTQCSKLVDEESVKECKQSIF